MRYRSIGQLEVSVVGLGGNNFGTDFFGGSCEFPEVDRILGAALDAGVNLVDTAEEYSITSFLGEGRSEEVLGQALRGRRDEFVVASKFDNRTEHDPAERGERRIVAAVEASLRRLGTDHIDLYQQHQPDPELPQEEVLAALDRLVRAGKVREVGCCNFDAAQIDAAAASAHSLGISPFRSCQLQYNLFERPADEVLAAARRNDVAVLAYFPLASGLLTGKYRASGPAPTEGRLVADGVVSQMLREGLMARRPPLSPERLAVVESLIEFASARGHTLLELAIGWLVAQDEVASVLTGVTSAVQVASNAAAAEWALDADDLHAVDQLVSAEA